MRVQVLATIFSLAPDKQGSSEILTRSCISIFLACECSRPSQRRGSNKDHSLRGQHDTVYVHVVPSHLQSAFFGLGPLWPRGC